MLFQHDPVIHTLPLLMIYIKSRYLVERERERGRGRERDGIKKRLDIFMEDRQCYVSIKIRITERKRERQRKCYRLPFTSW